MTGAIAKLKHSLAMRGKRLWPGRCTAITMQTSVAYGECA